MDGQTKHEFQSINMHTKEVKNMNLVKYRPYRMWFAEGFTSYQGKVLLAGYQSNNILEATEDTVKVKEEKTECNMHIDIIHNLICLFHYCRAKIT